MTGMNPDDDAARNIRNQQRADARPTKRELQGAQERQERRKELLDDLVREAVDAGYIESVFVDPQRGYTTTRPTRLATAAQELGRGDEYDAHLKDIDPHFVSIKVRSVADDLGLPIEEESRSNSGESK